MQKAMDDLNQDMDRQPPKDNDERQQPATLAHQIMASFGLNPFQTEFEGWIEHHDFHAQPALFHVNYFESVFNGAALTRPLLVFAMSPTLNIHGVYLGLDKMGHFFQQGYQYYKCYDQAMAQPHATRLDALAAAIRNGIGQEDGIYGSFTIGVYSNADMAANYAGLHFYLNLTQPVSLGGKIYPPIVELHEGRWRFTNNHVPDDMFTRFITDHMNESINPPCLAADIRGTYEKNVSERAEKWVKFYKTSLAIEKHRLSTLSRWYGEPYGYSGPAGCVTICQTYYHTGLPPMPSLPTVSRVAEK
jgi:hypothetical protein